MARGTHMADHRRMRSFCRIRRHHCADGDIKTSYQAAQTPRFAVVRVKGDYGELDALPPYFGLKTCVKQ
ncbi:hypothetical protein KCP74_20840 [Salmonella enterica subsp. enterica]|nr:hypothetical protein KCP74_20840 [Salmonella enterica subsp. enterica]